MGLSAHLKDECHSAMLHENMNISLLMVHANHTQEARARRKSTMLRGQDLLMMVFQKLSLRYKTSLDLIRGLQFKYLPKSQNVVVIGCLTLNPRTEKVLIHQPRIKFVGSVATNTMVIVLTGHIIVFVVEIFLTR